MFKRKGARVAIAYGTRNAIFATRRPTRGYYDKLLAARKGAGLSYRKGGYKTNRRLPRSITPKFFDFNTGVQVCGQTFNIIHVNPIAQGTDEINRLGRNITTKSVQVRAIFQANTTGVQSVARMMLVYDRQPNGALPVAADIMSFPGALVAQGYPNQDNRDRFLILMDKAYPVIGTSTTANTGLERQYVMKYKKLGNLITNWSSTGTTGVIGGLTTGSILCLLYGDVITGTAAATVNINFRFRFSDN